MYVKLDDALLTAYICKCSFYLDPPEEGSDFEEE